MQPQSNSQKYYRVKVILFKILHSTPRNKCTKLRPLVKYVSANVENKMFDRENTEKEDGDSQEVDVEGILPTLALDLSIPSELFSQYIEANFPSTEEDVSKATNPFQSIDDVFASHNFRCDVLETTTSRMSTCSERVSSGIKGAGKLAKFMTKLMRSNRL